MPKGQKDKKSTGRQDPGQEMVEMREIDEVEERERKSAGEELEFARSLYETEAVKQESKKAFSKISMLLIRYNRLQEIRKRQREEGERMEREENAAFERKVNDIRAYYGELQVSQNLTKEQAETLFNQGDEMKAAWASHNAELEKARNVKEYMGDELLDGIDKDTGGIRGALMLGGDTAFGKGYTMTDGSFEDVQKAGMYVADVGSGKGTLMEQMSLLDNAVNTGGMDLEAGQDKDGVAHQNLSQIFRSITDEEAAKLNARNGLKLKLNMDMIKKSREDKSMDKLIGKQKSKKTISQAAEERGVAYTVEKMKGDNVKLKQIGLTKEAEERKSGQRIGKLAGSRLPKMTLYQRMNNTSFNNRGLGDLWSLGQRRSKSHGGNAEERRQRIRAARLNFNKEVEQYKAKYRKKRFTEVNKTDKLEDEMKLFKANELKSKEELAAAGMLDKEKVEEFKAMDDVTMMRERLKEAKKKDSAGHMLAAYKMMGASAQELLDFRLALIAYMVPIGKSTVADIINESHAVGVVGGEGDAKYEDFPNKKDFYALLLKKADQVERENADEAEKTAYKWAIDKKKYRKKDDGSIEEVKEEEPAAKPEKDKAKPAGEEKKAGEGKKEEKKEEKKPVAWLSAADSKFITGGEGNRDPLFRDDKISVEDIKRGDTNDSWLLAPLAALAQSDPAYIRNELVKPNGDMAAQVRLFDKDGNPVNIVVSKNAVAEGSHESALWVRVVEKAALALKNRDSDEKTIHMKSLEDGNTELGMSMLLGKDKLKQIDIPEEKAGDKKDEILKAVKDAKGQKKLLTASASRGEEAELKKLGLRKSQAYTVIGEGKDPDTIKLRDTSGVAIVQKVKLVSTKGAEGTTGHGIGSVSLKKIADGILEIKIDDFLKYFSDLTIGGTAGEEKKEEAKPEEKKEEAKPEEKKEEPQKKEPPKEEPPKEEQKPEEKPEEKKEEAADLNDYLISAGIAEGDAIPAKWMELGNKLWKLAFVAKGKTYLDRVLAPVDRLISALVEEIKDKSDKKALTAKYNYILKAYNDIKINGAEIAGDLSGKMYEDNSEIIAAALALSNHAIEEVRPFTIGGKNLLRNPKVTKKLEDCTHWIGLIKAGETMPEDAAALRAQREQEEKPEEEEIEDDALALLFDEEKAKEDDLADGEHEFAVNAAFMKEPENEKAYAKRWEDMAKSIMQLINGKYKSDKLMFLVKFCFSQASALSGNVPLSRFRKNVILGKDRDAIKNNYIEIREMGRNLVTALSKQDFDGAGDAKILAGTIVKIAIRELEAFERGCGRINGEKDKKDMIWARALLIGKTGPFDDAEVIEKEKEPEKKEEQKAAPGIEFTEMVKQGADYVEFWRAMKEKLEGSVTEKFKLKHPGKGQVFKDYDKVVTSVNSIMTLLAAKSPRLLNAKQHSEISSRLKFYYSYIDSIGGVLSQVMGTDDVKNLEAAAALKQVSSLAKKELIYLISGIRQARKDDSIKDEDIKIFADYLVIGRKGYEAKKAQEAARLQQKEAGKGKAQPVAALQPQQPAGGGNDEAPKNEPEQIAGGGDHANEEPVNDDQVNDGHVNGDQANEGHEPPKDDEQKAEPPKDDAQIDRELEQLEEEVKNEGAKNEEAPGKDVAGPNLEAVQRETDLLKGRFAEEMKRYNKILGLEGEKEEEKAPGKKKAPDKKKAPEKKKAPGGRRNSISGPVEKKEDKPEEGRKRRMSVDLTHKTDPEKIADAAKEMKALNDGAKEVGKQSFVPISKGEIAKNRVVSGAQYVWGSAMMPVNALTMGVSKLILMFKKSRRPKDVQADRTGKNIKKIAGRGTKSLAEKKVPKDNEGKELVYDDTRNVPLVWEFVTAGDTEEEPEMSINVEQPVTGKTKASSGAKAGHTFISLSYTRHNLSTDNKERYKVEYGFYPKDGFVSTGLSINQGMKAMIPGMLSNDRGHSYSISKRYSIPVNKVNEVLKASENYANEGYNIMTRNCTTFAVEMGKIAGVPVADQIKESEYELGTVARIGSVFLGGFAPSARYTGEMDIEKMLTEKDESGYQFYGQKMATLGEREKYKKTRELLPRTPYGFSPAVAGETMRQVKEEKGETGSYLKLDVGKDFKSMGEAADDLTSDIVNKFTTLYQAEKGNAKDKSEGRKDDKGNEINPRYDMIQKIQAKDLWAKMKKYKSKLKPKQTAKEKLEEIKAFRKEINDWRKGFASFISGYPEYAKTCMEKSMQLLSILEEAINQLDDAYMEKYNMNYTGDLANMRDRYLRMDIPLKYKDAQNIEHEVRLPATIIEAYLQMFGSMDAAAPQMAEYCRYSNELLDAKTDKDKAVLKKRYANTIQTYKTATEFAASHRYLLNRKSFDKEELDYAFKELPQAEKLGENASVGDDMVAKKLLPSAMLQTLMLEPVFKGFGRDIGEFKSKKNKEEKTAWVKDRIMEVIQQENNKKELKRILAYFKKDSNENADAARDKFLNAMFDSFLPNFLFDCTNSDKERNEIINALKAWEEFKNYIDAVLAEVTVEDFTE